MSEDIEKRAKEMGHVSKEEWKGDPDKWRPADEFVKRGEEIVPILKDRLDKTERELKAALAMNKQELEEVKKVAYETAKKDYDRERKELEKKELEAFQTGDADAYHAAKKEAAALKPPDQPKAPALNPVFEDWQDKNKWYSDEPELAEYADFLGDKLFKENPKLPLSDIYDKVSAKVKKQFPDKFTNPRREDAGSVEGGSPAANGGKGNKFSDLPAAAKETYARLAAKAEKQGRKFTKEQYAQAYFE
jgi:hypothetical protein